jgi:hypothetical protein
VLTEKAAKGMESNLRPSIGHAFTSSIFGNFAYSEMKNAEKSVKTQTQIIKRDNENMKQFEKNLPEWLFNP